jgi:glutathione S-transferase
LSNSPNEYTHSLVSRLALLVMQIGIFLEEAQIPYEAHLIDIGKGDQFKPEFVKINPNSKIPAIVDPNGAGATLNTQAMQKSATCILL